MLTLYENYMYWKKDNEIFSLLFIPSIVNIVMFDDVDV